MGSIHLVYRVFMELARFKWKNPLFKAGFSKNGGRGGVRSRSLSLIRGLLYQLSYSSSTKVYHRYFTIVTDIEDLALLGLEQVKKGY